jgi:carbonic anhydrase/acetyltransferase-like protein (isoleucine patch superfamily)
LAQTPFKNQGVVRILLWIVYDVVWIAFAAVVYGSGILAAYGLVKGAHGLAEAIGLPGAVGAALAALPAYILALLVVVSIMGAIRAISPELKPGIYKKFRPGPFFTQVWLVGIYSLIDAMPFKRTVHFVAFLRYLFYRGQGMKTHYQNWVSQDVSIADPSLITLGKGVNLGGRVGITGHLALPDVVIIAPVTMGDSVVVGAEAKIGPGVTIGDKALIGATAILGMSVRVGESAYIEPGSFVPSHTVIGPRERWGGNPAVMLGRSPLRAERAEQARAEADAELSGAVPAGDPLRSSRPLHGPEDAKPADAAPEAEPGPDK